MGKTKALFSDIMLYVSYVVILSTAIIVGDSLWRIYVTDQFIIPTGSMTPTLIPGDRVIVNKLIMGARIYDDFDFSPGHPLKSHRTKGLRKVQHNDILVFNFPINKIEEKMEFKINFVYAKRCVGLPGDSVSIKNGYLHSNNYDGPIGDIEQQKLFSMVPDKNSGTFRAMPFDTINYNWTIKNFGPLYIPAKGGTIELNTINYKIYKLAIEYETGLELAVNSDSILMLGSKRADKYTFTNNYYFMCGDNVANSNDSRYWGFVPEDFIVGVVSHITYSRDRNTGKFRWNRLAKRL